MTAQPIPAFAPIELEGALFASVGAALAQARQLRALTIEQVAAVTRVPVRYLHAIEAERFEVIPGVIYLKGFVKAFARAVGLNDRWAVDAVKAALRDGARGTPPA